MHELSKLRDVAAERGSAGTPVSADTGETHYEEALLTSRSPDIPRASSAPCSGRPIRHRPWHRPSLLRALMPLARPLTSTMPWATLITGCLTGTGFLAIMAAVAEHAHASLSQGTGRIAFVPAIAALAFVVRDPLRPLSGATPVPAWAVPAGHLLLAAPVLAITGWVQLRIIAGTIPPSALGHPPAVYPVIAQLTGWCAIAVAAAACADRSRYADLGGAIAVPVAFAVIALAWYGPVTARYLVQPPGTAYGVTLAWYAITFAALTLTCAAMRDHWHLYSRHVHRLSSRQRNPS